MYPSSHVPHSLAADNVLQWVTYEFSRHEPPIRVCVWVFLHSKHVPASEQSKQFVASVQETLQ